MFTRGRLSLKEVNRKKKRRTRRGIVCDTCIGLLLLKREMTPTSPLIHRQSIGTRRDLHLRLDFQLENRNNERKWETFQCYGCVVYSCYLSQRTNVNKNTALARCNFNSVDQNILSCLVSIFILTFLIFQHLNIGRLS